MFASRHSTSADYANHDCVFKQKTIYIAGLIASKQGQSYSNALQFIWCKISFSLIDSASMCLRGPRSSFHATANEINFSDPPIDLLRRESRLGDWISPSLLTISLIIWLIVLFFPFFYEYYTTMRMCLHDCVVYVLYHRQCACVPDL